MSRHTAEKQTRTSQAPGHEQKASHIGFWLPMRQFATIEHWIWQAKAPTPQTNSQQMSK